MSNRIKPKIIVPQSREEAESLVGEIAALKNFQAQTVAAMDQRLQEVRQEYESQLASVNDDLTVPLLRIEAWAEANPQLFERSKSIAMLHGTIGWRIGNPAVKPAKGNTWAKVLEKLKALGLDAFIHHREDVNKEAILNAREHLLDGDKRNMGIQIVQDESFFVQPNATETEHRVTT